MVFRITDVQPYAAIFDLTPGGVVAYRAQNLRQNQFDKILLAEAHQTPVGQHGDSRVARAVGDQRFFAKGHTGTEIGEMDLAASAGDGA